MIDVIIPAYNASKTLGRALASLAAQTDKDFKVTVVDDCSSDAEACDMHDICNRYSRKHGGELDISFPGTGRNVGAGMARQYGIDNTDGEWITFLDADDVLMPYAIEAFKVIIANNPDANVIHSSFYKQQIDDNGGVSLIEVKRGYTWMHGKLYRRKFLEDYDICNSPKFSRWADDSYFNAQCTELTPLIMNELPMYVYTDTADSITHKEKARDKLIVLIKAMYFAGQRTLKHKDTVGHLHNTLGNIDRLIEESGIPLNDDEREWYDRLRDMYDKYGVKPEPEKKHRRLFKRA